MDLSLMILIDGGIIIVVALLYCFFGYKLARPLFPLCGILVIDALVYIYIYPLFVMNDLGTWLFFGGISVVLYVLFFLIQRIAGFFTGALGSALILIFAVIAFGLQKIDYLYPACLTICAVSGLLAVVYKRRAVIVFTSLFGACAASFVGMYMYITGVGTGGLILSGSLFIYFGNFLSANALLILGISIVGWVLGMFIQFFVTAHQKVLPGNSDWEYEARERTATGNSFLTESDKNENGTDEGF